MILILILTGCSSYLPKDGGIGHSSSSNPLMFPVPNHHLYFGYYFADGRWGNYTHETFPFTNLYIALNSGYDTSTDWRPQFRESIERAAAAGKDFFLLPPADQDWDEVLDIMTPHWERVKVIEIAHEADLTIGETEALAATLNARLDGRGLTRKVIGITQTQTQSLGTSPNGGQAMFAPSVGWIGIEAYVDAPGSPDSAVNVSNLNQFLQAAKARVPAGKQIGIIMQSYDRNGDWWNADTLADLQTPAYLHSYNDPRVTMILMFAYARTGGARFYPQIKAIHQEMARSIGIWN